MKALFGFGFTQEDELIVASTLDVAGQTVLCIASGGDIPLSLLARGARQVIAVDISAAQLELCSLKASAIQYLDREAAAGLLGFTLATQTQRRSWLATCIAHLPKETAAFWQLHELSLCERGAIWCGRYEQFIRTLQLIVSPLLGRAFKDLASCATLEEQHLIFDRRIGQPWLRAFFRLAFSREVYSRHGIDEKGLANRRSKVPLGEQYYAKLRSFCTATPARLNPWLQVHTIGHLLSFDAAPHYLGGGFSAVGNQAERISWVRSNVLDYVREPLPAEVTRVYLSNVPDWCTTLEFEQLICELARKLTPEARIVWCRLHADRQRPPKIPSSVLVEGVIGSPSYDQDRFPFYEYTCARIVAPSAPGFGENRG